MIEMDAQIKKMSMGKIISSNVFWGIVLWLFGYILGFVFFFIVPKDMIGWLVMPLGIILTLWVLFKKITRDQFTCYFGVGVFWTVIAVVLDYFLLVRLLHASDYYKFDVYLYYVLTFALPIIVGWYKFYVKKVK